MDCVRVRRFIRRHHCTTAGNHCNVFQLIGTRFRNHYENHFRNHFTNCYRGATPSFVGIGGTSIEEDIRRDLYAPVCEVDSEMDESCNNCIWLQGIGNRFGHIFDDHFDIFRNHYTTSSPGSSFYYGSETYKTFQPSYPSI